MSNLADELKQMIIDVLALEDISINDIETEAPLFGDGLGLDSIDALELGLALKKRYNNQMKPNNILNQFKVLLLWLKHSKRRKE